MSSRSGRSSHSGKKSRSSQQCEPTNISLPSHLDRFIVLISSNLVPRQSSNAQLIESLRTHRVNTLTELRRIERVAASCESEEEALAFQAPMTSAWSYYVGNQFLVELRGLTPNYPMSADVVAEAVRRVRSDPGSNRSWNMAWLCLIKIRDDCSDVSSQRVLEYNLLTPSSIHSGLIPHYSNNEAWKREMWGGRDPSQEEADQLGACFEWEWMQAIENMLRHWADGPPTWY
ncbi:hypothetical protein PFICI_02419 [Pestalotiopsis fici W106-1]|uniref:Uncharacterized protein n=1 Tax=Pestalotiopsis fici (strain W106-1 / CGMCC3.15140) TaxID=1229662 RepID=W3XEE8_PESFW|nr:uncharacterized protein PFICI_02419 [Pestalotiopsis fici W106-1]ETS84394.1 hypothetical protein PFICI_02419 [Pestalotiopsis fici W106-1]